MKSDILGHIKSGYRTIYKALPGKRLLFCALSSLGRPSPQITQHLHFSGKFKLALNGKNLWLTNYHSKLETSLFWHGIEGIVESTSIKYWLKLLPDARTIFDIGANTGLYSLVAKVMNPAAQVHSFEPIERIYSRLIQNCRLNQLDIHCWNIALSDYDGLATIYDLPLEHHSRASLVADQIRHLPYGLIETQTRVMKLQTFLEQESIETLDLMKLDVEGHEAAVLEGLGNHIAQMRPNILLEVQNPTLGKPLDDLLRPLNYLFFDVNENRGLQQVHSISKSSTRNY